jgi:hypothetical protein
VKVPVAVLSIALVSAATAFGSTASTNTRSARAAVTYSADRVWHDAQASLTVRYPDSWHVTTRNLTNITQPVPRFAIYSGAAPSRAPVASGEFTRRLRPNQVVAVVMEQTAVSAADLGRLPPRPHRFAVRRLTGVEGFGTRWVEFYFRDHGREFYLFIGVGEQATGQLPTLLHSLDTLRVSR